MVIDLPLELWHTVFRFATFVPGSLDGHIHSQIDSWDWAFYSGNPLDLRTYRTALATKKSLVLVSREWFNLCIDLLYEDVRLSSLQEIQRVSRMIKREELAIAGGGGSYGQFIKRLQVPSVAQTSHLSELLCEVAPFLPNLRIIYIEGWISTTSNHNQLAQALESSCPMLQYIFCNHWKPNRAVESWSYLTLPSVETARVVWGHGISIITPMSRQSQLRYLAVSFETGADFPMQDFHFPSLRTFSIRGYFGRLRSPGVMRFFDIHGPLLVSLQLYNETTDEEDQCEDEILRRCPRVREIVFLRLRLRINVRVDWFYPTVLDIGIAFSNQQADAFGSSGLPLPEISQSIGPMQFPSLRRLVSVDLGWVELNADKQKELAGWFPNRGNVLFQDSKGVLIPHSSH